jgi:hypothetical protein
MAKKKVKAKKRPAKNTPAKKKRVAATRKKTKKKSVAEQIDAFDWRVAKNVRIGSGLVPGE